MLTKTNQARSQDHRDAQQARKRTRAVLRFLWTLFVIGFAVVDWQLEMTAADAAPIVGLIIHTFMAGMIGLIVITLIEMRLDPAGFDE